MLNVLESNSRGCNLGSLDYGSTVTQVDEIERLLQTDKLTVLLWHWQSPVSIAAHNAVLFVGCLDAVEQILSYVPADRQLAYVTKQFTDSIIAQPLKGAAETGQVKC